MLKADLSTNYGVSPAERGSLVVANPLESVSFL